MYLAGVVLIWGLYYFSMEKLLQSGWDPEWMNALRFFIGGGALLFVVMLSGKTRGLVRIQKTHGWKIVTVAWVGVALGMWLLTWAQTMIPSGIAGALSVSLPLWVIALSALALFGALRIPRKGWIGIVLGTIGIILIYSPWTDSTPSSLGVLLVLGAMFFIALESTLFARWFSGEDPLLATTLVVLWAGVAFLCAALFGDFESGNWWLLLALAIFSNAIAYLLYLSLVLLRGAAFANLYNYLVPPIAIFAGIFFGTDIFSGWLLGGSLLAILGAVLAAHSLNKKEISP